MTDEQWEALQQLKELYKQLVEFIVELQKEATPFMTLTFLSVSKELAMSFEDLYHQCVESFYAGYVPKFYDRHGDLSGFNLYSPGADIDYNINGVDIPVEAHEFNYGALLDYKSPRFSKFDSMSNFANGIRGFKELGTGGRGNPRGWGQRFSVKAEIRYGNETIPVSGTPGEIFKMFYDNYDKYSKQLTEYYAETLSETMFPAVGRFLRGEF